MDEVQDAVREFLKTLTFTTELPLPAPVQVDLTPDGVRVAVLSVSSGSLHVIGDLLFTFQQTYECDNNEPHACDWTCSVHRRWPDGAGGGTLPGEKRLLAAFEKEFSSLLRSPGEDARRMMPAIQLPSWLSFFYAALPVGLGTDGPTAGQYRQYNLRRACRLEDRPRSLGL